MMRPSSLYRSDSRRQPIEASANNITEDSIDCGIALCKCCNTPGCHKLGNKRTFLIVLVACALIQGAIESYFRVSAKQAALNHDFDPRIVDWLLVASGIFTGVFAIAVAYLGNRVHRTAFLGGLFMLQSVLCLIVVIPTLANNSESNNTIDAIETSVLCIRNSHLTIEESPHGFATLVLLFVLQFGIGLGLIAFYTLGFSYLDDNVNEHESPALLAAALAAKFWGVQVGYFTTLIVGATPFGWFLGWVFLAPLLFTVGIIALMFPRRLLSTVVKQAANSILESATNSSHASLANSKFIADIGFFPTIYRLVCNKILLFNIFAAVFVQTAFVNFTRHEPNYLQSRFFLPNSEADGLNNEWTSQLVTSLLRPPMVALAILVAGLFIAKANPRPRKLVIWNIIAASLVAVFFITSIFIDCENSPVAGSHRGKLVRPHCSNACYCSDNVPFMPVCPENGIQTFYSPCYAGCGAEITINNVRVYGNCTCGADTNIVAEDLIATEGACGMEDCQKFWIAYQALSVVAAALLGSTLIGKLIITLRSVLPQDKSSALGIELAIIALIVYIPGKLGYRFIADRTCQYMAPDNFRCFLHESPVYGDWLNVVTATLIAIGVIFEVLLLFSITELPLYGDEPEDVYRPIEMESMRSPNDDPYNDIPTPDQALLQRYDQPAPPLPENPPPVQYAQILRQAPNPTFPNSGPSAFAPLVLPPITDDQFDFRMQQPRQAAFNASDNGSIASDASRPVQRQFSGASSISSGYIDVTPTNNNNNQNLLKRNVRPTSPETSF